MSPSRTAVTIRRTRGVRHHVTAKPSSAKTHEADAEEPRQGERHRVAPPRPAEAHDRHGVALDAEELPGPPSLVDPAHPRTTAHLPLGFHLAVCDTLDVGKSSLGRVVDPGALDLSAGPRARLSVEVPEAWLAEGADVAVTAPARLVCARCDGGGCDGCARSGALRSPEGARLRASFPPRAPGARP